MTEWGDAGDDGRPLQVHGRWTVSATVRRWSPAATLFSSSEGAWSLRSVLGDGGDLVLGWTALELAGICAEDLLHPDDRDLLEDVVDNAGVATGDFVPLELRLLARDSRYWWTRWHLTVGTDASCAAHGVEYLRPDRERGCPMATWRWFVDTDVVLWSPELLDMFALRVGPPPSYSSFLATIDPDDRGRVAGRLSQAVEDRQPFRYTFRCPTGGSAERWFHTAGRCEVAADGTRQVAGLVKYLNPPSTWPPAERTIGCG
jgi:hypothetical protein